MPVGDGGGFGGRQAFHRGQSGEGIIGFGDVEGLRLEEGWMNPILNDVLPPLENLKKRVQETDVTRVNGRVEQVVGLVIESSGPLAAVGEACWITPADGTGQPVLAEVVGFRQ